MEKNEPYWKKKNFRGKMVRFQNFKFFLEIMDS